MITMALAGAIGSSHSRSIHLLLAILIHLLTCSGQPDLEADVLIRFRDSLKNAGALSNWNKATTPCNANVENWNGLVCRAGTVSGLRLDNMGLEGAIDVNSLSMLPLLSIISFENNNFDGPLPDLAKLRGLSSISLSNNKFSGEIPAGLFNEMVALTKVHLANNMFSGPIPISLAVLPRLMELKLENNEFSGEIPQFRSDSLVELNLSNNYLEGEVPRSLHNFPASAFEGNKDLCGASLKSCTAPNKLSLGTIITVIILLVAAFSALVAVVVILLRHKSPSSQQPEATIVAARGGRGPRQAEQKTADLDKMEKGKAAAKAPALSAPKKHGGQVKKSEPNLKITFLREDAAKFDIQDLLKAAAEVLGSGVFGATYKTDLGLGQLVVVKRFKHMNNVNKQDFIEHMRRLGRLSHPNLLPYSGYYYRKEEKLFVTDYAENFSLATHLHCNKSHSQTSLNWPARLHIMKGVARGLLYLYNELPSLTVPHGHLKSSNVLLNTSNSPLLNDYCLMPVVNLEDAQQHMICYNSPEFQQSGRITKKTDVWSLGILIVEILTGKFPPNFLQQGKGSNSMDVAAWVESVVGDNPSPDILDTTMVRAKQCDAEIMKLLKIGLSCCEVDVDKRPDIKEAVDQIEEVKEE